jgi:hypothetical protein
MNQQKRIESLILSNSALQSVIGSLTQAKKQAEEIAQQVMRDKLGTEGMTQLFELVTKHMQQMEVTRSQTYGAVIMNTALFLDHAAQTTTDAKTKEQLVDIIKNLHLTVQQ